MAIWFDWDDTFHDITTHIDQVVAELQKRRAQIPAKRDNRHQQIKQRERHYWAFRANPHIYNIDEVLNDRKVEIGYWRNPHNSDIQAGDRVLIWRKSINGQPGGIVALGDVLEDSQIPDDIHKEYWLKPQKGDEKIQRVKFRYGTRARGSLSSSMATIRWSVFHTFFLSVPAIACQTSRDSLEGALACISLLVDSETAPTEAVFSQAVAWNIAGMAP